MISMLDTGYSMLDKNDKQKRHKGTKAEGTKGMLDTRFSILDAGYWMLDARYWI